MEKTMQAGFLVEPGVIELREIPVPVPGEGEVVARVHTALTCGTDLKTYRRGHPKVTLPSLFGHEFSGTVAAVGRGVQDFREGDAVMTVFSAPCGNCYYCIRGDEHLCERLKSSLMFGAYAEYILIPAVIVGKNMFPKPYSVSFKEAAILEPLSCAMHGVDASGARPDDSVLVIGAGTIGLLHIAALKEKGVGRLIVSARGKDRLELASKLGADEVIDAEAEDTGERLKEITGGYGANIVIECTGTKDVWEKSIDYVSKGGKIILFGGLPEGESVRYDAERIHYDHIGLQGVFHYRREDIVSARNLLLSGSAHLERIISGDYPLGELREVFRMLDEKKGVKYSILP